MTGELAGIGLFNPKAATNVAGVLRAAGCFGAAMVAVQGLRYTRSPIDVQKAYQSLPLLHAADLHDVIPFDAVPVAVEITESARSLITYQHPPRAFYVFGPEDGTLGKNVLSWCRDVVYIPTTLCMNLAATVSVVLYDRIAKMERARRRVGLTRGASGVVAGAA